MRTEKEKLVTAKYLEELRVFITENGEAFREIKQWEDKDGYKYITVNRKNYAIHRLVASAFVQGKSDENRIVMHKDDNKQNNNAENLAWGTYSQNNYDAAVHGLKSRCVRVKCMETGEEFHSGREAAFKMFGTPRRADKIIMAAREKRGKAYGYHWEVVRR